MHMRFVMASMCCEESGGRRYVFVIMMFGDENLSFNVLMFSMQVSSLNLLYREEEWMSLLVPS